MKHHWDTGLCGVELAEVYVEVACLGPMAIRASAPGLTRRYDLGPRRMSSCRERECVKQQPTAG